MPSARKTAIQSKQDSVKKIALPEHCKLCFSALHKAIGVFTNSLSNNQSPEVFISHSKLIIMVGQKLVDSLCQETQERDARNDILHSSSRFCSLLKNLAVATKNAAIQYPNTGAMRELQDQIEELSKYTQQFRAMMEWQALRCFLQILHRYDSLFAPLACGSQAGQMQLRDIDFVRPTNSWRAVPWVLVQGRIHTTADAEEEL